MSKNIELLAIDTNNCDKSIPVTEEFYQKLLKNLETCPIESDGQTDEFGTIVHDHLRGRKGVSELEVATVIYKHILKSFELGTD